jgi:S1-C subfamily serine protease
MYCNNCSNKINQGDTFCTNCGAKTENKNIIQANKKVKAGLNGWLALAGLGLIASPLVTAYGLLPYFQYLNQTYNIPGYLTLLQFEFVMGIAYVIASIYLIYLYFKKNIKFPNYYIVFLVVTIAYSILDYVWLASLTAPTPEQQKVITDALANSGSTFRTIIFAIIWISYMKKSKQVKATFINNDAKNYILQALKKGKIRSSRYLLWGAIVFCIIAFMLVYAFSSNSHGINNKSTSSQIQSSQKNSVDNSQSAVDVNCNNNKGGSGTIFSEDGIVLTNNHVIAGASYCSITLPDTATGTIKEIYRAEPIIIPNLSKQYDIAYLKIYDVYTDTDGKTWGKYPANFPAFIAPSGCDKYTPHLGDSVRIYGYPVTSGGYNLTITDGIISSFDDNNDILTTAQIDSGNSGGLAVSQNGCFLGIPSAVVSGNYQNLGIIIPSSIVDQFSSQVSQVFAFDSSCLKLNGGQMYGNTSNNSNPTYSASLYNGCSKAVTNVTIKVNFYAAGVTNTANTAPLDSEYIDAGTTYLSPKDSYAINEIVNTNVDTSGDFTWTARVYSAYPD